MRRVAIGIVAVVALGLAGLGAVLGLAHLAIRELDPPLPSDAEIESFLAAPGGPVGVAWQLTASQPGCRAARCSTPRSTPKATPPT